MPPRVYACRPTAAGPGWPVWGRRAAGVRAAADWLRRVGYLIVLGGQVAVDQVLVVLWVEDRPADVRAGEGLDRGPGLPEADRDDLGPVALHPRQRPGPAVAGRALIAVDAGLLHVGQVGGGVRGPDRSAPGSRDHVPILAQRSSRAVR